MVVSHCFVSIFTKYPNSIVFVLQYVHGSLEDPKTLTHHKLLHAATERVLIDTKTVADENLKDKGMNPLWYNDKKPCTDFCELTIFHICYRCFAAHKEKTTTDPSKDGRCKCR